MAPLFAVLTTTISRVSRPRVPNSFPRRSSTSGSCQAGVSGASQKAASENLFLSSGPETTTRWERPEAIPRLACYLDIAAGGARKASPAFLDDRIHRCRQEPTYASPHMYFLRCPAPEIRLKTSTITLLQGVQARWYCLSSLFGSHGPVQPQFARQLTRPTSVTSSRSVRRSVLAPAWRSASRT